MADGSPGTQALMMSLFLRYVDRLLELRLFPTIFKAIHTSLEEIQDIVLFFNEAKWQ